jgi:hypothetical protein
VPHETVIISAADRLYGSQLLNLVGSVHARSNCFDRIVVFDLGLTSLQRLLLRETRGVELRPMRPFVAHWAQCWSWKPWILTQVEARRILYLDAGTTVLRELREPLEQIDERGYFVVGTGHPNREHTPSEYYDLYALPKWFSDTDCVGGNVIGFARGSRFYDDVVLPTVEDVKRGRNLGWSEDEATWRNVGINRMDAPPVRDARRFRHDQTLLNIHFYLAIESPYVNPTVPYAPSAGPREHPEQLLWAHRRRAAFPHIADIPFATRRARVAGRALGTLLQARWWLRVNGLAPRAYLRRLTRALGRLRFTLHGSPPLRREDKRAPQ